MADQKIQVEVSGDSSGLLGALSKGLDGLKSFAKGWNEGMAESQAGSKKFGTEIQQLEGKVKGLKEEFLKLKQAELAGGGDAALSAQIKATGAALSNAQRDLAAFRGGAGPAAQEINHLENAMLGLKNASPELGEKLEGVAGSGKFMALGIAGVAAAVVASLAMITRGFAERADEAGKSAQKIGLSVEAFTRLKYAAELADVPVEGLEKGLGQLAKNMQESLWTPSSAAARTLDELGIKAADANGNLRPLNDVLEEAADKFSKMPDGPEKTAAAMNLFGKSGKDLIPLLNQGKAGIAELEKEADKLGVTLTEQDAAAAEKFNDNLKRMNAGFEGVKNRIAREFLPAADDFSAWAAQDGPSAMNVLTYAVRGLITAWKTVVFVIQTFGAVVGAVIGSVIDNVSMLAKALWRAAKGDFDGAWDAIKGGAKDIKNEWLAAGDEIHDKWQGLGESLNQTWDENLRPKLKMKERGEGNDDAKPKGDGSGVPEAPMYTMWTKAEQETMDKLAAIRAKGFDEFRKLTEVYDQGEAASRVQQIGFQEKAAEEALKRGDISNAEYIRRMQAFEDEKYQIQLKALQDEAAVDGLDAVKKQEIFNKIELLAQAHQNTMRVIGEHTVQQTAQNTKTLDTVVKTLQTGFGSAFANILTRAQTFSQAMGNFFRSMATTVLNALGQMIARTLLYKAVTIAANSGIISSENAKRIATLLGVQADTAAAAATTTKAAASSAAVGPNVANAASQTFETHSGIPIVGAIIAAALVLLMLSTMSKAKGRAVGGLVGEKGPELTMLGEKGLEVVAPEHDFKDWAKGLVGMGANMGANLTYQRAQVEALNRTAASYANAPLRQGDGSQAAQGGQAAPIHIHFNAPIWDSSNRGMQQLGRHVMDATRLAARQIGVTVQPGQTFGGL